MERVLLNTSLNPSHRDDDRGNSLPNRRASMNVTASTGNNSNNSSGGGGKKSVIGKR